MTFTSAPSRLMNKLSVQMIIVFSVVSTVYRKCNSANPKIRTTIYAMPYEMRRASVFFRALDFHFPPRASFSANKTILTFK